MKASWIAPFIALASHLAAAISIPSTFELAHTNVTLYAHDINIFISAGQPDSSRTQLHADAEAAIQQLELSTVEFKANGAFSAADAASLEAIANGIEGTMSDLCHSILATILPTADAGTTSLLSKDLATLSETFDTALVTLEPLVPAAVKSQIATVKTNLEAVCPAT